MITKTRILRTSCVDPWWNLSVEEYLLDNLEEGECVLYLWQNKNTVVIGKNQNPWKECRTDLLEREDGKLARRLSGGGAVFHDLGNLNFTFLMRKEDYDLVKQFGVILEGVNKLGIKAVMSGRNDITVEGRKFSGNAFCFRRSCAYHHGTILVSADMDKLSRYLQVSKEKMAAKGVTSVQSRVVNLLEYNPGLTIDDTAGAVMEAFEEIYGCEPHVFGNTDNMDQDTLKDLYVKYSSWEWRYGEAPKFDIELSVRFPWGGLELCFNLEKSVVRSAAAYSDAIDEEFITLLPGALENCKFQSGLLAERVQSIQAEGIRAQMASDIAGWLLEKGF